MRVCLVTGGGGFIGSHLTEALVERGDQVRVVDDFSTGSPTNLAAVKDRVELFPGDLSDADILRHACRGVEVVFHQAIPTFRGRSLADPNAVGWACAPGLLQVLIAAREAGVRRVVYGSGASVYGKATPGQFLGESQAPEPASPFAFALLTGEQHCSDFTSAYGLETVRLRYFNVFGPRQLPSGPCGQVAAIVQAMVASRSPQLPGGADRPYNLTYVDDVVHANLLAAETPRTAGKVYNIARGRPASLLDVVTALNVILGTHLEPIFGGEALAISERGLADVRLAEAELGFCAATDLQKGLRQWLVDYVPQCAGFGRVRRFHGPSGGTPHLTLIPKPQASDEGHPPVLAATVPAAEAGSQPREE